MLAGKFSPCNILGSSMFEWHGQVGLNTFMLLTAAGKSMPKKHQGWKGTITNKQDQSGIPCLIEN